VTLGWIVVVLGLPLAFWVVCFYLWYRSGRRLERIQQRYEKALDQFGEERGGEK